MEGLCYECLAFRCFDKFFASFIFPQVVYKAQYSFTNRVSFNQCFIVFVKAFLFKGTQVCQEVETFSNILLGDLWIREFCFNELVGVSEVDRVVPLLDCLFGDTKELG